MKVYIAKHYWKNRESATWESHVKLDKEIFKYLKQNYHNFVQDRPVMIKEGKYYIYLCYEDEVDIYGRKITNVTFFVSKTKVSEQLCSKNYHNLELNVSNRQMKFFGIFLLLLGVFFIYTNTVENKIDKNGTSKEMIADVKKHPSVSTKEDRSVKKHKKAENTEKVKLNQYVKNQFQDCNFSIKTYENYMTEKNKLTVINAKIKGKNHLLNTDNNNSFLRLQNLVSPYKKLMENGLKCNIDVIKNKQKVKVKKLLFNKKEIKILKKKKYKIHIVTKPSEDIVDGVLNIKELELIKLFNGEVVKEEIDNGYYLKLEKIKGEHNESRTKE